MENKPTATDEFSQRIGKRRESPKPAKIIGMMLAGIAAATMMTGCMSKESRVGRMEAYEVVRTMEEAKSSLLVKAVDIERALASQQINLDSPRIPELCSQIAVGQSAKQWLASVENIGYSTRYGVEEQEKEAVNGWSKMRCGPR